MVNLTHAKSVTAYSPLGSLYSHLGASSFLLRASFGPRTEPILKACIFNKATNSSSLKLASPEVPSGVKVTNHDLTGVTQSRKV